MARAGVGCWLIGPTSALTFSAESIGCVGDMVVAGGRWVTARLVVWEKIVTSRIRGSRKYKRG